MREIVILPTAYFPDIGYCTVLAGSKKATIDAGEHFIKQSLRNRCEILGPNGKMLLIVPLARWKSNSPVRDIKISYADDWRRRHWKSLEASYRSSPYFEYYEESLRPFFSGRPYQFLVDLNSDILDFAIRVLGLETETSYSLEYLNPVNAFADYRQKVKTSKVTGGNREYTQVFGSGIFTANLSFIDLICNEGPKSIHLLKAEE